MRLARNPPRTNNQQHSYFAQRGGCWFKAVDRLNHASAVEPTTNQQPATQQRREATLYTNLLGGT
jgi:hypothetical protein